MNMKLFTDILIVVIAGLHLWFLILEMFLWRKPLGLKVFKNTLEKAEVTSALAANQGLYNGFLASGLLISLFFSDPSLVFSFQVFFLTCVSVAGLYGAWTVSGKILWIQGLPAILTLVLVLISRNIIG